MYEGLNSYPQVHYKKLGVTVHACDLSLGEAESGEPQRLADQSVL